MPTPEATTAAPAAEAGAADGPARTGRAAPMAAEDRRRTIIEVVVPLMLEHGGEVSTRQIAEAAGIAEGTIFRVFPDKASLLTAAADAVINPPDAREQHEASLAGLVDLRDKVRVTVERMSARSERSTVVLMALRRAWMSRPGKPATATHQHRHRADDPQSIFQRSSTNLQEMLVSLFAPHAEELRVEPAIAAVLMRTLVLGSRHPGTDPATALTPAQITDALLDGVLSSKDH